MKVYDVIVAGGGIAGVSAAVAAAREGASVLLLEKQCLLGGLATSGLVTIYLPLCDGNGSQVSFGLAEELLRLSIKDGWQGKYPAPWLENGTEEEKQSVRYEVQYNPYHFALELEKLLIENGVDLLYDTLVTEVMINGDKMTAVRVDGVEGGRYIRGKAFVDATGDARLSFLAGLPTVTCKDSNIIANWFYFFSEGKQKLEKMGIVEETDYMEKTRHTGPALSAARYTGDTAKDSTEFLLAGHKLVLNECKNRREKEAGFEITALPAMPQLRIIRTADGPGKLTESHQQDLHSDSIGLAGDWRRRGFVYEIPFSVLKTGLSNVFTAGRCVNADREVLEWLRVIPACAVTGQAAGIAAAHADDLSLQKIQECLASQGQILKLQKAKD